MATVERFVCDVPGCGKSFDTQEAYAGHVGFHKLVGTYPCPECATDGITTVFSLPQGLGAHRRAKHGIVGSADKNVRKQLKKQGAKPTPKQGAEPTLERATDVPPMKVIQIPPGLTRWPPEEEEGEQEQAATEPLIVTPVATNGTDPIDATIRAALTPLVDRYNTLLGRQIELVAEMEHNAHDLNELWGVLGAVGDKAGVLPPPPNPGVQVAFQKKVSDSLRERGEEWLSVRKQSFTSGDMARAVGVAPSTATNLIQELRDEGKVRLVGRRGRSKTYLSTIGAR
jgi:DNA-binding transcriptional ArsR family regulator